jgi:hypothetical protein
MTQKDKTHLNFDDIVFNNRNKEFGAYEIRNKYRRNLYLSLGFALLFASISSVFLLFVKNEPQKNIAKITKVKLEKKNKKKEVPPPPPPPPPKEVVEKIKEQIEKQVATQQVVQQIEVVNPTTSDAKGDGTGSGNGDGPGGGSGKCLYPEDLDGDGLTCEDACPKNSGPASNKGCPPLNPDDFDANRVYQPGELKTVVNVRGAKCDSNASNPKQYMCFKNEFKNLLLDLYSSDISFKDEVLTELEAMGITNESQNTSATRAKRTVDLAIIIEKDGSISISNVTGQSQKLKTIAKEIFMELNKTNKKYLLPGQYQKEGSAIHAARMKYNHSIEFSYEE